ncbi:MAG: hypothetical protein OXG59_14445, partial [Gammaproteobacteria bacterium]|nr:hypothetical protein [Gammaproteobacteria bacterium]
AQADSPWTLLYGLPLALVLRLEKPGLQRSLRTPIETASAAITESANYAEIARKVNIVQVRR